MSAAALTAVPADGRDSRPGLGRLTAVELRKMTDTRAGFWLQLVIVALTVVGLRTGRVRGVALEDPPGANGSYDQEAVAAEVEAAVARSHADSAAETAGLLAHNPLWAADDARREGGTCGAAAVALRPAAPARAHDRGRARARPFCRVTGG